MTSFSPLLAEVRASTICAEHLTHGVRPVLQIHSQARVLIAGQAPGRKVHESGVPFDDASGNRLREWMGVTREADSHCSNGLLLSRHREIRGSSTAT